MRKRFYPKEYICETYYSKAMANFKGFADKTVRRTDGQTEGPTTACPRSIDAGA